MPEAVAFVLDASQYMRNGNLSPSRLYQQRATAEFLIRGKIHSNMENVCSVTAAANTPVLLCPMTHEERHLINAVQQCKESDGFDLVKGIMQARLAVKHRQKRQQTPSIICFIGSPFIRGTPEATEKALRSVAKMLRKESVGLIFILFGENVSPENLAILENTISDANKDGNSRIVQHISNDPYAQLVDTVRRAGVLTGEEQGLTADEDPELADALRQIAAAEGGTYGGSIDTAAEAIDDPELAEAIRLSLLDFQQTNEENKETASKKVDGPRVDEPPGDTVIPAENEEDIPNVIQTTGQIDYNAPELREMLSSYNIHVDEDDNKQDGKKEDEEEAKKEEKKDGEEETKKE